MSITGIGIIAGGSTTKSTIIVITESGSIVTCSNGIVTKTATEKDGQWRFDNIDNGIWTVTATKNAMINEKTVNVSKFDVYYIEMPFVRIYGISRDITASSTAWARTDRAVGMIATASVGTNAGHSDFDNVMPWAGIVRETLSTNDVMVKIPKFYYRRYREGNIEHIQIADNPENGFNVHPLFAHNGKENDYAYIGAYKTSNDKKSVSGATPQVNQTRATMRNNAESKGAGWSLIDIAALSAIQMLMLVEYADNNTQKVIGQGYCNGSSALQTGSCDNVPGLTGRPAGTDGKVDVIYRGIEGIWGNVWEWVDGVNFNNGTFYVCNNQLKYADNTATDYTALSYETPTNLDGYITREGLDTGVNTHVMFPIAASSGSATTNFCDYVETATDWRVFAHGGQWTRGSDCGLFCTYLSYKSLDTIPSISSRLLYIPS